MPDKTKEVQLIRELAKRVAEIAADPIHEEKKRMWIKLNQLERVRPLIHVQAIDDSIWSELIPNEQFVCETPMMREQEISLRRKIYCWEHFRDDRVVEDVVESPIRIFGESKGEHFGVPFESKLPDREFGAKKFVPVINDEKDIDLINTNPEVSVDWEETDRGYNRLRELYDGILRVEKKGVDFIWVSLIDTVIQWRGIEQTFVDLVERPVWVHDMLERMKSAISSSHHQMEALGVLARSDGNTGLGSGGFGWTDELPREGYDGTHVRLSDMWARAATQIFTEGISPQAHDEFAIQYEKPLLEEFGLSAYGCCEPLHNKLRFVKQI